ncbi:transducin beta-like protein 2 isoform X3 [Orussus abietinus]|uniref:transducin beta-like protein 2 isoform X3 n=1 Tax=Orussus abietinus TaxID=222816 RepID=UPI00062532C9|nr:transducin beta-like protein 2 isoform X3 [Orussus abietinus]
MDLAAVIGSLFLGALVLGLACLLGARHRQGKRSTDNNEQSKPAQPVDASATVTSHGQSGKRAKNKKRREVQQEFTHSWMVSTLKGHTGPVLDMDFSSNGKYLATCAEDRTVLLWHTKNFTKNEKKPVRVNIEYDHATLVRWSPDDKAFIIHKAVANCVEVYKVSKKLDGFIGAATKVFEFPKRHTEEVVGMDIASTGLFIATCSVANDLVIWNLKGQPLTTLNTYLGSTYRIRVSPCGRFVAASGFIPDVQVWDVEFTKSGEFKNVADAFKLTGHSSGVYDFGFSADSGHMVTVSKDRTYRFYNTKVEYQKGEDPRLLGNSNWEGEEPVSISMSPNAEILTIANLSSLSFHVLDGGKLDTTIEDVFIGPITSVAFNAIGQYILVAGDKHVKILHNVPGYRATIESAKKKLKQKQTSATKERLLKSIADCENFLTSLQESHSL